MHTMMYGCSYTTCECMAESATPYTNIFILTQQNFHCSPKWLCKINTFCGIKLPLVYKLLCVYIPMFVVRSKSIMPDSP